MLRLRKVLLVLIAGTLILLTIELLFFHTKEVPRSKYRNEFAEARKGRNRTLPDCIIFGVKKGGTRALLEFINIHPDVEISRQEVHYFNFDYHYNRSISWYISQMPLVKKGQLTVEKSPNYFISSQAPKRIAKVKKEIKLILAVREPVERAISDFAQSYWRKNITFESLAFTDESFTNISFKWPPIRLSSYDRHMSRWLEVFPLNQILVVECSKLASSPAAEMQRVERFLGLRPYISEDNFFFSEQKGFMCWRKTLNDPGRCLGARKGLKHPDVSPAAIARLRRHYRRSVREFYKQINMDFGWPTD